MPGARVPPCWAIDWPDTAEWGEVTRRPLKVLPSILLVFGGMYAYGIVAVEVLGPERLAASGGFHK
jgi:hypothetical protein